MNFLAIIILATMICDFLLNAIADILNLSGITDEVPEPFKGVYDADKYKKSQNYLRVGTRFGWMRAIFDSLLILVFWFGSGFELMDQWVRTFDISPVARGLIYIGILIFVKSILSLPFSIYGTFVIEERFGFNKTTRQTYIADLFKGLILGLLIGTPLLSGILVFFNYAGPIGWLYCWLAVTLFSLFFQYIAPNWIMPLFNKYEPIEEGELKTAIMDYAKSIQFSLENIFIMDGSKRSSKSNAFFTGFGRNKRIVLFDTLVKEHTTDELVAVLAHEMGHYKKKHILKMLIAGILQMGLVLYLLSLFISYQKLFDAFYMTHVSVYGGLIFFGMLYSPIDFFIGMFVQAYSRKNEYEADRFAVKTTSRPKALIDALKKLSVNNLSNLTPHPFYTFLHASHPPVLERIKAINAV